MCCFKLILPRVIAARCCAESHGRVEAPGFSPVNRVSYYEVVILIPLRGIAGKLTTTGFAVGRVCSSKLSRFAGVIGAGASRRNPERGRPAPESKELFFVVITNPRQRSKDWRLSLLITYSCQPATAPSRLLLAGGSFCSTTHEYNP